MTENSNNNNKYQKEIESEICIDELILNKNNLSNSQKLNFSLTTGTSILNNNNINNDFIQTNILLNSVQEFFNRYELDERKVFSKKKFVISFKELIMLITESISTQQKIDNLIYTSSKNLNNIQNINQKYINNLIYNIFSFDRIDIDHFSNLRKKEKKIKTNINSYNLNFLNNSKIKKNNNSQVFINPNNIKNDINIIIKNIYKEVFVNGNNLGTISNTRNINTSKKANLSKTKNFLKNERNKSAILYKKDARTLFFNNKSKNKNGNGNKKLNNNIITNNINNNISYNNNSNNNINISNNNNSHEKKSFNFFSLHKKNKRILKKSNTYKNIKTKKNHNKKDSKYSDIFQACENLNILKKSVNTKPLSRSNNFCQKKNINIDSFLKKSFKNAGILDGYNSTTDIHGYGGLKINGIKKIIVSNVHKPSNLANKLLLSGQKYIDEFKENNENLKKKII